MTSRTRPTVLISGAGIAGTTLAFWLARHGFRPTVVERAAGLRSSGNPIDVRGPAVAVAEAMGVMPQLRRAATEVTALSFVNRSGREVGRVNMRALQRASAARTWRSPAPTWRRSCTRRAGSPRSSSSATP
ncbi:NAD(P)-binding protein [Streptacidiphilus griseoplanus]|uniref:NAD(P)-binding protein n=1 Tax=Peterkaempfera griseoplana TaxID=66896 RepID=UPI000ACCE705|nr:hypothetical protein [Peterkaempfera griseoplana]